SHCLGDTEVFALSDTRPHLLYRWSSPGQEIWWAKRPGNSSGAYSQRVRTYRRDSRCLEESRETAPRSPLRRCCRGSQGCGHLIAGNWGCEGSREGSSSQDHWECSRWRKMVEGAY